MAPFDRSYTTFYWPAIVSIALSCTYRRVYRQTSYHSIVRAMYTRRSVKILKVSLSVLTEYTNVSDGRTNRQTDTARRY